MRDKVFLDTNILVYAHDDGAPEKKAKAQALILDGLRSGKTVISTQVLSEFYVTVTRKIKIPMSIEQARREIDLLSNMETADVDIATIRRAIDMQDRWKINYWDGLILAAAEQADCAVVFSEDLADGQSYGDITVRNPLK